MFWIKKKEQIETEIPPLYRTVPWTKGRWKLQQRIYVPMIYARGIWSYEDIPDGVYDNHEDAQADLLHMMGGGNVY